ncbi:MAG: DUF4124 domain-containing protein [Candidatus Thiodiazotropha sp.]
MIFLVSQPLLARDVYKWVTSDGEVIYSENYQPGAERIRVRDDQKKSALNTDQLEGQAAAEASGDYTDFEIVQPTNNETIRSADSSVSVGISLTPPLAEGHEIYLYVDGTKLKSAIKTTQLVLQNLVRGSHTLKAELQDGEGTVLRESPSISFNLRQEALE